MQKVGYKYADLKVNLRLRDFIVDFLACLVPGFIFLMIMSTMLLGFLMITGKYISLNTNIANDLRSFISIFGTLDKFLSLKLWTFILIIVLSYVLGHLLYRQDPKEPDYVSFINIREKVMRYNPWVISKDDGVTRKDVQFPYSNLAKYLSVRGFDSLSKHIKWKLGIEEEKEENHKHEEYYQRSKAFINKLKTRISFFFPENTLNIIKNEAHIRLASSMWYGTKYTINATYFLIPAIAAFIFKITSNWWAILPIILSLIPLICGFIIKEIIEKRIAKEEKKIMVKNSKIYHDKNREKNNRKLAKRIRLHFRLYDIAPSITILCLIFASYILWKKNIVKHLSLMPLISIYLTISFFLFIGILFVKYQIERSFHYQRVREIIYVLETAHIAKVFEEKSVDFLWHLNIGAEVEKSKKETEAINDMGKRRPSCINNESNK